LSFQKSHWTTNKKVKSINSWRNRQQVNWKDWPWTTDFSWRWQEGSNKDLSRFVVAGSWCHQPSDDDVFHTGHGKLLNLLARLLLFLEFWNIHSCRIIWFFKGKFIQKDGASTPDFSRFSFYFIASEVNHLLIFLDPHLLHS
jgi:hypothetical protein